MSVGRKNLGDIDNRGRATLEKMTRATESRLTDAAKKHAESRKSGDDNSLVTIEERGQSLESDIRTFMEGSVERLQKVLTSEVEETEAHLDGVKDDLLKLSEKLKSSISDLKKAYEENLKHISDSLADQYEGSVDTTTAELDDQSFQSQKSLRAHSTFVINSLQQKLDHSLWESRGQEKNYNSSLFKTFMQKANSIDSHFSTLMQKLSADFQSHYKILESQTQQVEYDLNQQSFDLFQSVDNQGDQLEEEVNEFFKAAAENHTSVLNQSLTAQAQDLSQVHDETTRSLSDKTKELTAGLIAASGEARDALNSRCNSLKEEMDTTLSSIKQSLDEKMENSSKMKEMLEEEKRLIFEGIHKELSEIWESFEKRMTNLTTEAVAHVSTITQDAEKDIMAAQKNCQAKIRQDGSSARSEIEEAIGNFLEMLAKQKSLALEEIAKSAGSQLQPLKETPKPRRSKRTREQAPQDTAG